MSFDRSSGLRIALASAFFGAAIAASPAAHADVTFSATGLTPADIQSQVDAFRAALGPNNGVGGTFAGGRREVNWDGVPDNVSAPNTLPSTFFNFNSPRGIVVTSPGGELQASADSLNPTQTAPRFGNIDASYPARFKTFSGERLFTARGINRLQSNIVEVSFFIPGTHVPATTRAFGAVFTDISEQSSVIDAYRPDGTNHAGYLLNPRPQGLTFLGVVFDEPISRVLLQVGTAGLRPGVIDDAFEHDVVALDDFIYAEPRSQFDIFEDGAE